MIKGINNLMIAGMFLLIINGCAIVPSSPVDGMINLADAGLSNSIVINKFGLTI